jgi:hypothetical protein
MDGVHLMNLLAVVISFYNEPCCTREKNVEIEEQPSMTLIMKMGTASEIHYSNLPGFPSRFLITI